MQSRIHTSATKLKLEIKELTRYHPSLIEDINVLRNQLQKCIDFAFPKFNSLFKSKYYSKLHMTLLKEFDNSLLPHLKNVISFDDEEKL